MVSIIGSSQIKVIRRIHVQLIDFIAQKGDVNILFNYFPKQTRSLRQFTIAKETTKQKIYFSALGKASDNLSHYEPLRSYNW
jgi:heptosyltransferase-2